MYSKTSIYRMDQYQANRQRLSDQVLEHLTQLIMERSLKPGDELPSEAELAENYRVSKPVIRVALNQLSAMGIVDIRQGKPTKVRSLSSAPLELFFRLAVRVSKEGLKEAIELRRSLETSIAELAAEHITETNLAALEEILNDLDQHKYTVEEWIQSDLAFHHLLAKSAKNKLMLFLMEALSGTIEESIRILHLHRELRDPEATWQRHADIVGALKARDSEKVKNAIYAHFDASAPIIETYFNNADQRDPT
jgi:GntR family transcriptional repressor for pyruvate dehydrogenase complex